MAIASMQHQQGATTRAPYRMSIEMAGLLTMLLGAWGGIVPYVGPLFGFSADGSAAWTWNLPHGFLFLLPGAVAVFSAFLLMVAGGSTAPGRHRALGLIGFLVAICGAWFVVGAFAWPVIHGSNFFVGGSTPLREFAYWIGYSLGTGGLLIALGAFVMGRPKAIESVVVL